jgi:hypothetical protein
MVGCDIYQPGQYTLWAKRSSVSGTIQGVLIENEAYLMQLSLHSSSPIRAGLVATFGLSLE